MTTMEKKPEKTPIMKPDMLTKYEEITTITPPRGRTEAYGPGAETRGKPYDHYRCHYTPSRGRTEVFGPGAETHGARATTTTSVKSRILAWEWWNEGGRGEVPRRPEVRGRRCDLRV